MLRKAFRSNAERGDGMFPIPGAQVGKAHGDQSLSSRRIERGQRLELLDFITPAVSKPMALRAGDSRLFEVVVQRRDGFDDEIEIAKSLPVQVERHRVLVEHGHRRPTGLQRLAQPPFLSPHPRVQQADFHSASLRSSNE